MWDSDPDTGNLENGDWGHEWNFTYAGNSPLNHGRRSEKDASVSRTRLYFNFFR